MARTEAETLNSASDGLLQYRLQREPVLKPGTGRLIETTIRQTALQ